MPPTTSFTIWIEHGAASAALRAEVHCTVCRKALRPPEGVYLLRLTLDDERTRLYGSLRGPDDRQWSFGSGSGLAALLETLGHLHEEHGPEGGGRSGPDRGQDG